MGVYSDIDVYTRDRDAFLPAVFGSGDQSADLQDECSVPAVLGGGAHLCFKCPKSIFSS